VHPDAAELLVVPLACSLLGEEAVVVIQPGTRAASVMGAGPSLERFFCRFGLNPTYLDALTAGGLIISGFDEQGDARVAEIRDHPYFVGRCSSLSCRPTGPGSIP